jgi:hypothetical protein
MARAHCAAIDERYALIRDSTSILSIPRSRRNKYMCHKAASKLNDTWHGKAPLDLQGEAANKRRADVERRGRSYVGQTVYVRGHHTGGRRE